MFHYSKVPYPIYVMGQTDLGKQCRSRSNAKDVWSGSTLFASYTGVYRHVKELINGLSGSQRDFIYDLGQVFKGVKMSQYSG